MRKNQKRKGLLALTALLCAVTMAASSAAGITGEAPAGTAQAAAEIQPVEPVQPIKPVEPVKPIEPVSELEPMKPIEPVEPIEPAQPVSPVTPVTPVEPIKPLEPASPAQPNSPAKPASGASANTEAAPNSGAAPNAEPEGGEESRLEAASGLPMPPAGGGANEEEPPAAQSAEGTPLQIFLVVAAFLALFFGALVAVNPELRGRLAALRKGDEPEKETRKKPPDGNA